MPKADSSVAKIRVLSGAGRASRVSQVLAAAAVVASVCGGQLAPAALEISVNSRSTGFSEAHPPAAFDVDHDGACELIVSSAGGELGVFDSKTLKPIWSRKVSDRALTPPVVGDFAGDGSYVIAAGDAEGKVWFLRGGDGKQLGVSPAAGPAPITVAPATVALKGRDGVVVCDDSGALRVFVLGDQQAKELFNVPNDLDVSSGVASQRSLGRVVNPPSCADLNADGVSEIIMGTLSGAIQIISVDSPKVRNVYRAAQGTGISTSVAVADYLKKGHPQMAFATTNGEVVIIDATPAPEAGGHFNISEAQRGSKLGGTATGHVFALDVDGDGYIDLAGSSEHVVPVFDGGTQFQTFGSQPYSNMELLRTGVSVARLANGKPVLLFADARDYIWRLDPTSKDQESERVKHEEGPNGIMPAGDLTGEGLVQLAYVKNANKSLCLVTLKGLQSQKGSLPTMTYGIDFTRSGAWTPATTERLAAAASRFDARFDDALKAAKSATASSNDSQVAIEDAAGLKPRNAEVLSLNSSLQWKKHWLSRVLTALVILAVAGAAAFFALRGAKRKGRQKRAEQLAQHGDFEKALSEYRGILAAQPGDRQTTVSIAKLYLSRDEVPAEALELLRRARPFMPDNGDLNVAIAKAAAAAGEETDDALDSYLVGIASLQAGRGLMAYRAANVMRRRGDLEQAIKYYKMALREGYTEPEATEALADCYIATNEFNDKSLPVLEAAAKSRANDPEFLEGLCLCYIAAKRQDARPRRVATRLLQLKPDSLIGMRLSARCELTAGEPAESARLAVLALKSDPNDTETAELLAQSFLALRRTDAEAEAAYRKALENAGGDRPDLMAAVAYCTLLRGDASDAAFELVNSASAANAEDADLALGLARIANARYDHVTSAAALERVIALGRGTPQVWQLLAQSYGALPAETLPPEQAERAWREELRVNPQDLEALMHLSRLLVRQGKTDPESMGTLETLVKKQLTSPDPEVGKHLVRTYLQNGRFDDAIRLVRQLAQVDREDVELQKLYAQASLATNRLDEAIRQYEEISRHKPDDKEATINLAMAYAQTQRNDEQAANVYKLALFLQPNGLGPVRLMLGRAHAAAHRYEEALEEFSKAAALGPAIQGRVLDEARTLAAAAPDRVDLRWFLANTLVANGKFDEAMPQLKAIFEIDPTQLKTLMHTYELILAKEPANPGANLQKGMLLKTQGKFEAARPFLEAALKSAPNDPEVIAELTDLYEDILNEHDDIPTRFAQGRLFFQQRDYDRAVGCFQKTIQDFRYENESAKLLGQCFVAKGMLEFALQEFKKLPPTEDDTKALLYDLAQRYEQKNDVVGAKQVYRQLYAADISYRNVKSKFESLAGATTDPLALEKTSLMTQLSEKARRRYELVEELGRGAMGIVYKARDNELDEYVALKILPDNLSQDPEALVRFKSEARSARRLAHPNIVRIHDIGEEMGRKYISMEFVDGGDLKRFLKERGSRLDPREVARLMAPVASALDYAHSMGIVHRDIKPANIMLNANGSVKVSDFGIAKILEMASDTATGAVIGTPMYMSPEQVQGKPVDNRADIYSLGVMMYEFSNGRPPFFEGDLAYQHVHQAPEPISDVPQPLNDIILKCLAKDKDARWKAAGEIVRALDRAGLLED